MRSGFSLVELLISMAVASLLLTGVLAAFNLNSRLARVQTQVADMQQSARVSQYDLTRITRMTGRGGLPAVLSYEPSDQTMEGVALELRNNVPANTQIGDGDSPDVVPNTDVLTLRGVFASPIYQVDLQASPPLDPDSSTGTVSVGFFSPSGVPQDLTALRNAVLDTESGEEPEPVILVSSVGTAYAVVELTGGTVTENGGQIVTVEFTYANSGGGRTSQYAELNVGGVFPESMTRAAYVGLLEEYRYYIRDDPDGPPRLSRARFYPNTDDAHTTNPTLQEDVADNVSDLQIAFGIDSNDNGIFDPATEWLWDEDDDDATDLGWMGSRPYYLRVNTIARTNRPDPKYLDPAIIWVEDREYDEPDKPSDPDERLERSFRRKLLQNIVDLRNLG